MSRLCCLHRQIVAYSNLSSNSIVVTRHVRSLAGPRSKKLRKHADQAENPVIDDQRSPAENSSSGDFTLDSIPEELRNRKISDFDAKYQMLMGHEETGGHYVESSYGLVRFDQPLSKTKGKIKRISVQEQNINARSQAVSDFDFGVFDSQLASSHSPTECSSNSETQISDENHKPTKYTSSSKDALKSRHHNADKEIEIGGQVSAFQFANYQSHMNRKLRAFEHFGKNEKASTGSESMKQNKVETDSSENIFDVQYFNAQDEAGRSAKNKQRTPSSISAEVNNKAELRRPDSKENLFDAQYFGDHILDTQAEVVAESPTKLLKSDQERKQENALSSEDNIFDSQYFGAVQDSHAQKKLETEDSMFPNRLFHQHDHIVSPDANDNSFDSRYFERRGQTEEKAKSVIGISSKEENARSSKVEKTTAQSNVTFGTGDNFFDEHYFSTGGAQVSDPLSKLSRTEQLHHTQQESQTRDYSIKNEDVHDFNINARQLGESTTETDKRKKNGRAERKSRMQATQEDIKNEDLCDFNISARQEGERTTKADKRKKSGRVERKVRMQATQEDIVIMPQTKHQLKPLLEPVPDTENPTTAYDVAMKIRAGETNKQKQKEAG